MHGNTFRELLPSMGQGCEVPRHRWIVRSQQRFSMWAKEEAVVGRRGEHAERGRPGQGSVLTKQATPWILTFQNPQQALKVCPVTGFSLPPWLVFGEICKQGSVKGTHFSSLSPWDRAGVHPPKAHLSYRLRNRQVSRWPGRKWWRQKEDCSSTRVAFGPFCLFIAKPQGRFRTLLVPTPDVLTFY